MSNVSAPTSSATQCGCGTAGFDPEKSSGWSRPVRCPSGPRYASDTQLMPDRTVHAAIRQCIVEWAQEKRQRRAELVADVGEEGRLRAVQFGERIRSPRAAARQDTAKAIAEDNWSASS